MLNNRYNSKFLLLCIFFLFSGGLIFSGEVPFYNESFQFQAKWKGITVGNVYMTTKKLPEKKLLRIYAKITTFAMLKKMYYVAGVLGAEWNYEKRESYRAFEKVYQGKTYQKRYYLFRGGKIKVNKIEKDFNEYSWPHKKVLQTRKKSEWVKAPGFHDLLGAFYWLRTSKIAMRKGKIIRLKVLPAGNKNYILIKVLGKMRVKVLGMGKKVVYHVRSGLTSINNPKNLSGGQMLIKTKSPIDMYITDDANKIPVKMWTDVDYLGRVEVNLVKYSQP